jgi:predicted RNase H-related nuclease YkuK (DUF458 family)
MKWRRFNGQTINPPIKKAVEATIIKEIDLGHKLKVCIGTDSQVRGSVIEFATVIVFLREKKGGFMFISNSKTKQTMGIRERMITEVARSVEVAYDLCNIFDAYDVAIEVHADINTEPHFKYNNSLK